MYHFIDNDEWAREAIREIKINGKYAIDTETTGLDPHTAQLLLIQIANEDGKVIIFDARKISKGAMSDYLSFLFSAAKTLIFANAKFDWKFILKNYNLVPGKGKVQDVILNEGILYNGLENPFYSLKELAAKYLKVDLDKDTRLEFINYKNDFFTDEQLEYAARDVVFLFDILDLQEHYLAKAEMLAIAELEGDLTVATAGMELAGVLLDTKAWLDIYKETLEEQEIQLKVLQEKVAELKGCIWIDPKTGKEKEYDFTVEKFNPRSYQQTLAILRSRGFKLDSSNSDLLEKLDDDIARAIIQYRKLGKLTSSYGINIIELINPVTGRIHGQFNQILPQSGRFSSENPNLQNIPARGEGAKYRKCFIAPEGRVQVTADFSNMELREAGDFSNDEVIIEAYKTGQDLHKISAAAMYNIPLEEVTDDQRFNGKTFNFSVLYGASAFKVSTALQIPIIVAEVLVQNWKNKFANLAKYLDETATFLKENGYVKTPMGRRRYFPMPSPRVEGYWKTISRFVREGCNHPIQGANADITKIAIVNIFYRIRDLDAELIRTVHDEITIECDEEIKDLIQDIMITEMIEAGEIFLKTVPVKVDCKATKEWAH